MIVYHHPSDALMLDYASGALGEGWSLAVATHLALCPQCRRSLARAEAMGGCLLEDLTPADVDDRAFETLMARVSAGDGAEVADPAGTRRPETAARQRKPLLPEPLRSYAGADADSLPWQRLGLGAYQIVLQTGTPGVTARLLRIPAGRPVPEHSHKGLELTLVLAGAFDDCTGHYGRGDFQEADDDLFHQPHAVAGEDCICLAVTEAPLRFKGLAARLIQPLFNI